MKFSLKITDISKLDKIKEALSYLSPNIDLTVLNDVYERDILIINENIIKISSFKTRIFSDDIKIETKYRTIKLYELFYYTHILKNKIDLIVKINSFNEYKELINMNYKIHNSRYYDYVIIIDDNMHFIGQVIFNVFFSNKQTIDMNFFLRVTKIKQLL